LTRSALEAFAEEVKAAATATDEEDAPLIAGTHCHFCRASGGCSVLADYALSAARETFRALERPLDPERLARLLHEADTVRSWLKALEAHALQIAKDGVTIPGFKLAQRCGHRRWNDPDGALAELATRFNLSKDQLAPRALVSPAQAEKIVKASAGRKPDLSALTVTPTLGPRLVPDKAQGEDVFAEAINLFAGLED
jgi:hypothetical protein